MASAVVDPAESSIVSTGEELLPRLSFSLTRTETAQSFNNNANDTVNSAFAASGMTSTQLHDTFLSAEHFVAVVLSRLHKDPMAIDPKMWSLQDHANRLWALKQQALIGSCETSRGSKEYLQALDATAMASARNAGSGQFIRWRPCCFRMLGESKIKLWQNLGDMPHEQAKIWYIHIVTDICPEWRNPLRTDSALLASELLAIQLYIHSNLMIVVSLRLCGCVLPIEWLQRAWTPDDESDQCTICAEAFTFLNRRHHCRRCLSLVCAVCSPHSAPLRVFTQTTTPKRLRICNACFHEMSGTSNNSSKKNQLRRSITSASSSHNTDEDSLLGGGAAYPYSDDQADLEDLAASTNTSANTNTVNKHAAYLTSVTIHCGSLEFFHGSGFRKSWDEYFFVLLIRKGSLGMFLQAQDHLEQKKRPAAVFKLSGYAIRVKSQKRRPHQFRVSHPTKKILHFAARSIEEMNAWISQFIKAIDVANELEALAPIRMGRSPRRGSFTSSQSGSGNGSPRSMSPPENDFNEEDGEGEMENAEDIDIEALAATGGGRRRGGLDERDENAAEDDE